MALVDEVTVQTEPHTRSLATTDQVEPLDWMEHPLPRKWRIGSRIVEMDWSLTPVSTPERSGQP